MGRAPGAGAEPGYAPLHLDRPAFAPAEGGVWVDHLESVDVGPRVGREPIDEVSANFVAVVWQPTMGPVR